MGVMSSAAINQQVGAAVRAELARKRRTQAELAEALQVSPATIGARLNGDREFGVGQLCAIAEWLDVDVLDLFPTSSASGSAA
jgi:transcriptional regulator with XRE-family HTH domain